MKLVWKWLKAWLLGKFLPVALKLLKKLATWLIRQLQTFLKWLLKQLR